MTWFVRVAWVGEPLLSGLAAEHADSLEKREGHGPDAAGDKYRDDIGEAAQFREKPPEFIAMGVNPVSDVLDFDSERDDAGVGVGTGRGASSRQRRVVLGTSLCWVVG